MSEVQRLTAEQFRFEIRFALGQAGAANFIGAHAKRPEARLKGLDALTSIVAARLDVLTVTRELRPNCDPPLCGNGR